jgi:hypothetical protein
MSDRCQLNAFAYRRGVVRLKSQCGARTRLGTGGQQRGLSLCVVARIGPLGLRPDSNDLLSRMVRFPDAERGISM